MQKASNDGWNGLQTTRNRLSTYGMDQTRPNSLGTLRAATTGAPPLCGDALVAYEKPKREKKCVGSENGYEKMPEINVVNMLCSGKMVVLCETGMSRPH